MRQEGGLKAACRADDGIMKCLRIFKKRIMPHIGYHNRLLIREGRFLKENVMLADDAYYWGCVCCDPVAIIKR